MKHKKETTRKMMLDLLKLGCDKKTRVRIWDRLQFLDQKNR